MSCLVLKTHAEEMSGSPPPTGTLLVEFNRRKITFKELNSKVSFQEPRPRKFS